MANNTANYRGQGSLQSFTAVLKNVDGTRAEDITQQVLDVSIYEDIFSKSLFGVMTLKDTVNLMNGMTTDSIPNFKPFPIVGEEFIEFTYTVLSYPEVFRRFAINAIKEIVVDGNFTSRTYVIEFCSEEHLFDATCLVQKSYKDQISNMVEDILKNYLQVNQTAPNGKKIKTYDIQPTKGVQNLVIPRLSPFETMDFFARRSLAQNTFQSGTYLFFENKDGFNFCDIEYLIQRGKKKYASNPIQYSYYYQNNNLQPTSTTTGFTLQDDSKTFKTIVNLTQKHKFDTIEKLRNGYFESDALVYDVNARKTVNNTFKFIDNYQNLNTLGAVNSANSSVSSIAESSYPENSLDFIKSVTSNTDTSLFSSFLGVFGLSKNQKTPKHTKAFFLMKDSTLPDTYLENILMNKASYMTRLAQNMFTAEVYGDPNIGAGDVITIDLPEITGTDKGSNSKTNQFDTFLSGYFMVTSIHHMISPETYRCTYDLYKNGFSTPVVTTDSPDKPAPSNSAYLNNAAAIKG